MKMVLAPDHIPVNSYELIVVGAPPLRFTSIGGLEEELETVDLPDRTTASGGNKKPVEFDCMHPKHHAVEDAFLEFWFEEAELCFPTYKKPVTLIVRSISGLQVRTYNLIGVYPTKRKTPDLEMKNEGDLFETTWTFKGDLVIVA